MAETQAEAGEPLLIKSARRMAETHPHRHIRIVSGSGTTVGAFMAEFDAYIEQVESKAWDEGKATGFSRAMRYMSAAPSVDTNPPNPYRVTESEGGR